jgi:1,5-anhydro-D-fructose reductase (1,5-anhydro-D-mannitol-forming)
MGESVRWLVVGIGDITSKRVLPAILAEPRSRLAGIVTRDPAKAAPFGARAWVGLDDALRECECDAVYVATPVFLHAEQTLMSLRAGRHVLCEKPMAVRYEDARAMVETARDTGRLLGIAYYRRMYEKVNRARQLLAEGAIGRPVLAEASAHDWWEGGAFRSWLTQPELAGGGPLYDIACHRLDLMNYLFGAPVQACGQMSTLVQKFPVEDNATVLVEHESGVRSVVDVRWHSRVARDEFRIRGTEGELDLSPLNGPQLRGPGGEENLPAPANLHYPCVENFVDSVLGCGRLRSSGESALPTDWVLSQVE